MTDLGLANEITVHLQGVEDLLRVEHILDEDVIPVFHLQAVLVSMGRYYDGDGAVTIGVFQCRDHILQ